MRRRILRVWILLRRARDSRRAAPQRSVFCSPPTDHCWDRAVLLAVDRQPAEARLARLQRED